MKDLLSHHCLCSNIRPTHLPPCCEFTFCFVDRSAVAVLLLSRIIFSLGHVELSPCCIRFPLFRIYISNSTVCSLRLAGNAMLSSNAREAEEMWRLNLNFKKYGLYGCSTGAYLKCDATHKVKHFIIPRFSFYTIFMYVFFFFSPHQAQLLGTAKDGTRRCVAFCHVCHTIV